MKPINEILDNEIEEQIKIRRDLMNQMVGTLYPQVLLNEIIELRKRLKMSKQ